MGAVELLLQALRAGDLGEQFEISQVIFRYLDEDLTKSELGLMRVGIIPEGIEFKEILWQHAVSLQLLGVVWKTVCLLPPQDIWQSV